MAGLLLLAARPARAEPPTTVVLLRTRDGDRWRAAEERARDELRMMGLRVAEVVVREDPSEIERAMAEHGAHAAIRFEREGERGSATMWWADADGARRAARLEGLATEGRAAAPLAALRAAELVRAEALARGGPRREDAVPEDISTTAGAGVPVPGLRDTSTPATSEVDRAAPGGAGPRPTAHAGAPSDPRDSSGAGLLPPPPVGAVRRPGPAEPRAGNARRAPLDALELVEAEPPPQPTPSLPTTSRPTRGAVGLDAGVGGGPGGAGALIGGGLTLRGHVTRSLAIQGELQGATSPVWLSGQDAQLRVGLAGARVALIVVARRDAPVAWQLGLGGGPTLAWALARAPDRTRSQDLVAVAALRASVRAAIRARARLRVVLGVDLELLAPPVAVRVRGAELARLGAPLLRGVLGLEWDAWPRRRR